MRLLDTVLKTSMERMLIQTEFQKLSRTDESSKISERNLTNDLTTSLV